MQFLTDVPSKSHAAQALSGSRQGSVRAGTEDPDADGEAESDQEADETGRTRKGTTSRKRNNGDGPQFGDKGPERALEDLFSDDEPAKPAREESEATRDRSPSMDLDTPATRSRSPSVGRRAPMSLNRRRAFGSSLSARTDLVPFEEKPALVRTVEGMDRWFTLENANAVASTSAYTLDDAPFNPAVVFAPHPVAPTMSRSNSYLSAPAMTPVRSNSIGAHDPQTIKKPLPLPVQQLSGRLQPSSLPSTPPPPVIVATDSSKSEEWLWWDAVSKDAVLANAVPLLPFVGSQPLASIEPEWVDHSSR